MSEEESKHYRKAIFLSSVTLFYNVIEGIVSIAFGINDEALALFGFGADSFIEAISGVGILLMVVRIQQHPRTSKSAFETTALRITGMCFYLLSLGLVAGIIINLLASHQPQSTFAGTIISLVSIMVMCWLYVEKKNIGKILQSSPIIADANCTKVCIYMSGVLLLSSAIFELTKFLYADIMGTVGIIYFSVNEGRESFEKAKGKTECHCS
jgi:divalent metal cation (Fe/Co/Zn/Cd) transporter